MKKILTWAVFSAVLLIGTACCTQKVNLAQLKGEWTIQEANGMAVTDPGAYLGINPTAGFFYGSTSCNQISGNFDTDDRPGEIEFDDVRSTRMACENMLVEQAIVSAIDKVEYYTVKGDIATFMDEQKNTVLVLKKRSDTVVVSTNPVENTPARG